MNDYGHGTFETAKSTTRYAIENCGGQWWTGTGWGVSQTREEYDSTDDLPEWCGDTVKDEHSTVDFGGVLDIRYYEEADGGGAPAQDAYASVREV